MAKNTKGYLAHKMKNILILEGIASSGKTTLEKFLARSLPDSVVISEDATLMPIVDNADKDVAMAHLKKQLKTITDLLAKNVIVDRFHFTHAFRTRTALDVFSDIERGLQEMGIVIVILLTIDPKRIRERIEETALRRKDGWKKGAQGAIEDKVAYYKHQQEVLLSLLSASRLRNITIDTTEKAWGVYADAIINILRDDRPMSKA